ncbi:looped-hinge helix DNA binding domain-containing protein, AbrB family [Deinococcus reticulitermitis]|uniref:Looped-hinge helix DNA binding domain-containing protein, AbrB family n=1 Tax=Deinococcus reticulitermitis TaxID=856736 RepID=A0A1H7BM57_9DEIO|nr:AbrB/MazE/SpoVT family DNA-binding domain-containing protein [Deinococcus reticulitermitis]SEJ75642.1 looped-hinge helix DNA binding domain-containing protein, AbrB family [Deinococcus reticulitermitis]
MTHIVQAEVSADGQITLPPEIRERLQLKGQTALEFVIDGDAVILRPAEPDPWAAWLGIAPLPGGQSVDDFIRELRGKDEPTSAPGPEQRIVYLKAGEGLPEPL